MKKKFIITIISIITLIAMLVNSSYALTILNGQDITGDNSPQATALKQAKERVNEQTQKARQISRENRQPTEAEIAEYNAAIQAYNEALEAYTEYKGTQTTTTTVTPTPVTVPTPQPTTVAQPTGTTEQVSEKEAALQARYDELSRQIWETQNIKHETVDPSVLSEYSNVLNQLEDIQKTKPGYTDKKIWVSEELGYERLKQRAANGDLTMEQLDQYVKDGKMSQDAYEQFRKERLMYLEYQNRQASSGNTGSLTKAEQEELTSIKNSISSGTNGVGSNNSTLTPAEQLQYNALDQKRKDLEEQMREAREKGVSVEPEVYKEYEDVMKQRDAIGKTSTDQKIEWNGINFFEVGDDCRTGNMSKEKLDEYLKNGNINDAAYNHFRTELQESLEAKYTKNTITDEQKANLQKIYEEKYNSNEGLTSAERNNLKAMYESKAEAGTITDEEKANLEKIKKEEQEGSQAQQSANTETEKYDESLGKVTKSEVNKDPNKTFEISLPGLNSLGQYIFLSRTGGEIGANFLRDNLGSFSDLLCRYKGGTQFNISETYQSILGRNILDVRNGEKFDLGMNKPATMNPEDTSTAPKYTAEGGTITAGVNDGWDVAYILNHIRENSGADSDVQVAFWAAANESGPMPDNYLSQEGKAFAEYKEELKKMGGFEPKDQLNNQKMNFNGEKDEMIAGPISLKYVRGVANVQGSPNGKVDFGGISSIKIYDQNGKEIDQNTWKIAYDKQHENTSKNEEKTQNGDIGENGKYGANGLDGWFNYPYPEEEFNIIVKGSANKDLKYLSKVIVEFYDTDYTAEYQKLAGNYKIVDWEVKEKKEPCMYGGGYGVGYGQVVSYTMGPLGMQMTTTTKTCPEHNSSTPHYSVSGYELVANIEGSEEAQKLTVVLKSNKKTSDITYTVDTPAPPTVYPPYTPIIPNIIAGIPPIYYPPTYYPTPITPTGYPTPVTPTPITPTPITPTPTPPTPTPTPITPTPTPPTPTPTPTPPHFRMSISGVVWEDANTGKEGESDNIIGYKNDGSMEEGIENVIVTLYNAETNQMVPSGTDEGVVQNPVKTDRYGAYYFYEVPMGQYYVEFTYDGLTYESVTPYVTESGQGSSANYKQVPSNYIKSSKAAETVTQREEFNEKFYKIEGNGQGTVGNKSYGVSKNRSGAITANLEYNTSNGVSKIITTGADGTPLEPFKMSVKTGEVYPFTKLYNTEGYDIQINEDTFKANYPYMSYVNLGLKKRPEVDLAVMEDIDYARVTINQKQFDYLYNRRSKNKGFDIYLRKDNDYSSIVYNRAIYNSDYTYRIDQYRPATGDDFEENTISAMAIKGLKEKDQFNIPKEELKVFVTYRMTIRNQSGVPAVAVNELFDYFDNTYKLVTDNKVGTYEEPEVRVDIQREDRTLEKNKLVGQRSYYETNSVTNKKTGYIDWVVSGQTGNYVKMSTNSLKDVILESGEDVDIYVTFEVAKNDIRAILPGKKGNYIEINSYSTYNTGAQNSSAKAFGQIDRDSAPGNYDESNSNTYEDDSDSAPTINITIDQTPEKRTLNGLVWEDERNTTISETGQRVADGKKQSSENEIKDVIVQLVELVDAYDEAGNIANTYEYIWQEMYTGSNNLKYIDSKDGNIKNSDIGTVQEKTQSGNITDGWYKFVDYIPGNYIVRFKYGEEPKQINPETHNGKSYNGQDYKSTAYQTGFNTLNDEWYNLEDSNLNSANVSDAKDDEAQRIKVINYSGIDPQTGGKMINSVATNLYATENRRTDLYQALCDNTMMFAKTARFKIEVEYNRTKASDTETLPEYKVENIDFGLEQRPLNDMEFTKEITGIKITASNGDTIIDTANGIRKNVKWIKNNKKDNQAENQGLIEINMDEEVMQGMTVQLSYKMSVTNKGEIDTVGKVENGKVVSLGKTYYTGRYDPDTHIVTTAYDRVIDYVDNSMVFKAENNPDWQLIDKDNELKSISDMQAKGFIDSKIKIARYGIENGTRKLIDIHQVIESKKLGEKALKPGETNSVELVLSKTITGLDEVDDLDYENMAEIIQFSNEVGKKAYIPGDRSPEDIPKGDKNYGDREHDFDYTERVYITKPTGENRATYYLIIGAVVLVVLAGGIVIIKKKTLNK